MQENNPFKALFKFPKQQQFALFILLLVIVALQFAYYFIDFSLDEKPSAKAQNWTALQQDLDSLKSEKTDSEYKMYPFNPNFITDFKGYKLGMKTEEIDRLLAFRKQGKFANSPEEFQKVTGISDSLLATMVPYFKFPNWVNEKKQYPNKYPKDSSHYKISNSKWKEFPKKEALKITDINLATKEELMKISGIGDAISDRILKHKEVLGGGFVSMEQLNEVWGLSPEVLESLNKYFTIATLPKIKKIDINNASVKELGEFYYFKYPISKNIVVYRSMNGDIKIDDLSKIKGFPVDKIKIIALYLNF